MSAFLKIPAEFELCNRTWRVLRMSATKKRDLAKAHGTDLKTHELNGLCLFNEATIYLRVDRPQEAIFHTFLHELGHAVLHHMGWEMGDEEEELFVEGMGALLHQFMKSQKGTFR